MGTTAKRGRAWAACSLCLLLLAFVGLAACGGHSGDGVEQAAPEAAGDVGSLASKPADPPGGSCRRFTTCQPENPCHTGWVTGCRKNLPICTDIGGWLANGTTCGAGAVCSMGECVPCDAGAICELGDPAACQAGTINCRSGQPVCENPGPARDGTSCSGDDFVCKGGSCLWCVDGVTTCAPAEAPCHQGIMTACAETGGTCADTGVMQPDGSWCGPDAVCHDGECAACTWWAACVPDGQSCQAGYTTCDSGAPVCNPSGWLPDGTPCEGGGTCQAGLCGTSVPGPAEAPARPVLPQEQVLSLLSDAYANVPVDTWLTSWGTGGLQDVLVGADHVKRYFNLGFVAAETTGPNLIDATAMTHLHLDVWTPDASTFRLKLVDFGADGAFGGGDDSEHELSFDPGSAPPLVTSSWVSIDVQLSAFASLASRSHLAQHIFSAVASSGPATVYVANYYLYALASECRAGEACPGQPCLAGYVACSTGAPVCVESPLWLPDGTPCEGGTCQGGLCSAVTTRSVTGTGLTTFWMDGGATQTERALEIWGRSAIYRSDAGVVFRGGITWPDGAFQIDYVPEGPYLLEVERPGGFSYVATEASFTDVGMDVLGRPDLLVATLPTTVTFDLGGLVPLATSDVVGLVSSNAGLALTPLGAAGSGALPLGAEAVLGSAEWNGRPLLDGPRGDVTWLYQAATTVDAAIPAAVTAASRWVELPGSFRLADGVPATVDATLAPCPGTGSVTADWRISEFSALAAQVHPEAVAGSHRITVSARPHASPLAPNFRISSFPGGAGVPLLIVQPDAGAGDLAVAGVQYGRFLPPTWREYRHDRTIFRIPITAPGAVRSLALGAPVGVNRPIGDAPAIVTPALTPPRHLRIGGLDAWSGAGAVGLLPVVSWEPPEVIPAGRTPLYTVTVYEVQPTADGQGTQLIRRLDGKTTSTELLLPGTGMALGGRYLVTVNAEITATTIEAPFREALPEAFAMVVSREFTP